MKSIKKAGLHKAIWLITLVPLAIAWLMAYSGFGLPTSTKNNGRLIAAGIHVPEALTQIQQGKWGLLVISNDCNTLCQQQVYRMQQLHKSMAKHHDRLQPIWLSVQNEEADSDNLAVDIDFTKVQKMNNRTVLDWFNQQTLAWQDQSIWLVDPNGILVMQFLPELTGRQIMADIKWLLKASRIG
jgi:glutathione peroxidase-family protein